MYFKQRIGKIGEDLACKYLRKNNYKIIGRNYYCKQGEIDIIAKDGTYLVFIEVKYRRDHTCGSPLEAVNAKRYIAQLLLAVYLLATGGTAFVSLSCRCVTIMGHSEVHFSCGPRRPNYHLSMFNPLRIKVIFRYNCGF